MSEIIQHCAHVLGNSVIFPLRSSLNLIYVFSSCYSLLFFKKYVNRNTGYIVHGKHNKNAWEIQFSKGVKYNKVSKK